MKTILVTGGGGFLGAAAVRALLARGDRVIAFDTHFTQLADIVRDDHLVRLPGDITDMANVAQAMLAHRPDAVLHCAAVVGVISSLGSPIGVMRVNVEGALNLFEAMRLAGTKRCVHISSEETYGAFESDCIDEDHPQRPVMPYGISKLTVEHLGRTYRDLHGLDIINLRTSWVYGPGLPRSRIPKNLIEAALAGRALHLPNGGLTAIDHTYVDDSVAAMLCALDHAHHAFDAYNVASGRAVTMGEIVEIVSALVPGARLSIGDAPFEFTPGLVMVRKGALDVTRARNEWGWTPRHDMRSGLSAYVHALRQTTASPH